MVITKQCKIRSGPKGAYSRWAELVGDDSYEFDALLPYFEKSITFTPPATNLRAANATVQTGNLDGVRNGPLQVTYPNWANPVSSWVAIAFEELGMNQVHGFTDGVLNGGWSYTASTMKPGTQTRCSSEVAFLRESIMETTNLAIYEDTMARKILFNGTTATGVEVTSGTLTTSLTYNLTARKEVIVSAGVFHSPQLLMVSGVGPQAILEQQAIPVVAHLPGVGQNMWDHIFFGPDFQVDTVTHSNLADPSFSASATHDYNQYRTGILTNVGADMTAFEKLPGHLLDSKYLFSLGCDHLVITCIGILLAHKSSPLRSTDLSVPRDPLCYLLVVTNAKISLTSDFRRHRFRTRFSLPPGLAPHPTHPPRRLRWQCARPPQW